MDVEIPASTRPNRRTPKIEECFVTHEIAYVIPKRVQTNFLPLREWRGEERRGEERRGEERRGGEKIG
jgi:hypothetical protein